MNKDHLKDVRLNADNKYEYMGDTYVWEGSTRDVRLLFLSVGIAAVCEIGAGCIPHSGTDGHPWVMIPFLVALIMSLILVWRAASMLWGRKRGIKEYIKNQIDNWFQASSFFVGVGGIACVIASIITGGVNGIFLWCQLMASAAGISAYVLYKRITWQKVL